MTDIASVLSQISQASDPVEALRSAILDQDGAWPNENATGLFEIQLHSVIGLGPSQQAAVDDWIVQARIRAKSTP